jgi:hypothetical protein
VAAALVVEGALLLDPHPDARKLASAAKATIVTSLRECMESPS